MGDSATGMSYDRIRPETRRMFDIINETYVDATEMTFAGPRREATDIERIVLCDSVTGGWETLGDAYRAWLSDDALPVSHFVISRGGTVSQHALLCQSARGHASGAVVVTLLHDAGEGAYPERQLYALDALVEDIGQSIGRTLPILAGTPSETGARLSDDFPLACYQVDGWHANPDAEAPEELRGFVKVLRTGREGTMCPPAWRDVHWFVDGEEQSLAHAGETPSSDELSARLERLDETKDGFERRVFNRLADGYGLYGTMGLVTKEEGWQCDTVACQECGTPVPIWSSSVDEATGLDAYAQVTYAYRAFGYDARMQFLCPECARRHGEEPEHGGWLESPSSAAVPFFSLRLRDAANRTLSQVRPHVSRSRDLPGLLMVLAFLRGADSYDELNRPYRTCSTLYDMPEVFREQIRQVLFGETQPIVLPDEPQQPYAEVLIDSPHVRIVAGNVPPDEMDAVLAETQERQRREREERDLRYEEQMRRKQKERETAIAAAQPYVPPTQNGEPRTCPTARELRERLQRLRDTADDFVLRRFVTGWFSPDGIWPTKFDSRIVRLTCHECGNPAPVIMSRRWACTKAGAQVALPSYLDVAEAYRQSGIDARVAVLCLKCRSERKRGPWHDLFCGEETHYCFAIRLPGEDERHLTPLSPFMQCGRDVPMLMMVLSFIQGAGDWDSLNAAYPNLGDSLFPTAGQFVACLERVLFGEGDDGSGSEPPLARTQPWEERVRVDEEVAARWADGGFPWDRERIEMAFSLGTSSPTLPRNRSFQQVVREEGDYGKAVQTLLVRCASLRVGEFYDQAEVCLPEEHPPLCGEIPAYVGEKDLPGK